LPLKATFQRGADVVRQACELALPGGRARLACLPRRLLSCGLSADASVSTSLRKTAVDEVATIAVLDLFLRRSHVRRLMPSACQGWVLDSDWLCDRAPSSRRFRSFAKRSLRLRNSFRARLPTSLAPILVRPKSWRATYVTPSHFAKSSAFICFGVRLASCTTASASEEVKPLRPILWAHSMTAPIWSWLFGLNHTQAMSQRNMSSVSAAPTYLACLSISRLVNVSLAALSKARRRRPCRRRSVIGRFTAAPCCHL
jgi:hypothetical protein